ncbi:GNAT family N-acetyltransferase [Bacillus sp. T33-2]|uniref:GNAT family N-acetyltransferase n=1 Tax=Bacillus sp. T33-2 TaxID=2054168 RepID=UPI000C76DD6E|nr:GNAT family N-acetyltransferase [Bacillus sp. T33-2]PLR97412.1 GNAT family N-acetyltransferase [Bacillus sp. T33-2]
MELKVLTEKDYIESMKLSMYAFQYEIREEEIPKRKEMLKKHHVLGVWDHGKLASKLHLLSLKVTMGEKEWEMGGIAGVATYPEYRRAGCVTTLLTASLKEMQARRQIVSFLHPFDIGFYRKYGWEIISDNKKITIENKDLKMLDAPAGTVRRYKKEDYPEAIEAVYGQYSRKYSGMLVRDRDWWLNNIFHNETAAVFYNGKNEARGYIIYEMKDRIMEVREYVALDHHAKVSLWNFICQHDSMVGKVNMHVSAHESFPYFLKQPKVSTEIYPYFMGRIVDAETCLDQYPFSDTDGQVFLHITDQYAPWNDGSYLLSGNEVKAFRQKTGSACTTPPKRGLHLKINAVSAMLFGYKTPGELYEMGEMQGPESELLELEKKIPPVKPFFYDFF